MVEGAVVFYNSDKVHTNSLYQNQVSKLYQTSGNNFCSEGCVQGSHYADKLDKC